MHHTRLFLLLMLLAVGGCSTPAPFHHEFASGHYSSDIVQCAPYARSVSGLRLYGAAGDWWGEAAGHYPRGVTPVAGAVLVLKKTRHLPSGHVAVVIAVIGPREINVTHSNWGNTRSTRHIIYESMRARDVSPAGDWSAVRFWNDAKGVMGFPYPAYGFIYP